MEIRRKIEVFQKSGADQNRDDNSRAGELRSVFRIGSQSAGKRRKRTRQIKAQRSVKETKKQLKNKSGLRSPRKRKKLNIESH